MVDLNTTRQRTRVGGDVYLSPSPPDAGGEWRVDVGFTVPDWTARADAGTIRAAFPGTAILIGERWFEVCRVVPLDGAPHRTAYDLWPWDASHVIRTAFELTPKACDLLTRRHRNLQRRLGQGGLLAYLPVLTGLLPAADQKRLEIELGVPAVRATLISAFSLLGLSVPALAVSFAVSAGIEFDRFQELTSAVANLAPLALYLLIESGIRLYSTNAVKEPMGSLPVCLPLHVLRAFRGMNVSQEELDERLAAKPPARGLLAARDRVRVLDHTQYDLEVVSHLPKDHWTANVTGIEYQGDAYILLERELLKTPDGPRHRFLLQKPRHEILFKSYVRYVPEEVRDVYRAQEHAKTATWVETFAFLWGFIPGALQERLARQYNYRPDRWTLGSIIVAAIVGVLLVIRGVGAMAGSFASAGTTAAFFGGVYLLWEAAVRWSKVRAGLLPGSLLGVLLEPLARRCLRWE